MGANHGDWGGLCLPNLGQTRIKVKIHTWIENYIICSPQTWLSICTPELKTQNRKQIRDLGVRDLCESITVIFLVFQIFMNENQHIRPMSSIKLNNLDSCDGQMAGILDTVQIKKMSTRDCTDWVSLLANPCQGLVRFPSPPFSTSPCFLPVWLNWDKHK